MLKVLVLEDSLLLNQSIVLSLSKNNYEVVQVISTDEAYDILYQHQVDIILSDITIAEADVFEFAE